METKHTHVEPTCHEKNEAGSSVKNSVKEKGFGVFGDRENLVPGSAATGHFLGARDLL
jgi:hypothetical protein